MDSNALISIRQVVSSYLNEAGIYTLENYNRYLQICIEGLSHLNIYYVPSYRITYGTVDSINCYDLPDDFIDYYRIGVILDGKIWTLTKNDKIPTINAISCGEDLGDADNQGAIDIPYAHQYAINGGWNFGYYRVDKEKRRIVFSGDMIGRQIVLEYISTGVSLSGSTWVPRELSKVLKDYIHWKAIQRDPQVALNHREVARRDYYDSLAEYNRLQCSFTVDELLDALASGFGQSIKYRQ